MMRERVVSLNNKLLPVVRLSEALEIPESADAPTRLPVLVVRVGESEVALVVDDIVEGREVVIKSLGRHLQRVRGIMGATIFGDGSVVPILNVVDLLGKHEAEAVVAHTPSVAVPARVQRDTLTVMIVDDSPSVRRVMSNLIKGASWTPLTAKDGLDALEMLRSPGTYGKLRRLEAWLGGPGERPFATTAALQGGLALQRDVGKDSHLGSPVL